MGGGKTTAAVLMLSEPMLDGKFKALMLRNNLGNVSAGGGLVDEFENFFGAFAHVTRSGTPSAYLPSGARVDFNHTADQDPDVLYERIRGWQYDVIYYDEMTGCEWSTFGLLLSRNRGSGNWTGKFRGTCNPKKSHWLRTYLDWYIGVDGYPIAERDGCVRFLYQNGETVHDLVWGNSKAEVYEQARSSIDEAVANQNARGGSVKWEDMILSSVFYKGSLSENKVTLGRDSGYVGKIGLMGRKRAQANLGGNWNVDPDLNENLPITPEMAGGVRTNDPAITNELWITADIADAGTNNMIILVWQGFHVIDKLVLSRTTPRENAENILMMAERYQIANTHIIFDATNALYIQGYIPESIPFISSNSPKGMYQRGANRLKDECFLRLVEMLKRGNITMSDDVASSRYPIVSPSTGEVSYTLFFSEFLEEAQVVLFEQMPSGKKRLITKTEMKKRLGKGRSTDVIDTMAMRMLPTLDLEYGKEVESSIMAVRQREEDDEVDGNNNIYTVLGD